MTELTAKQDLESRWLPEPAAIAVAVAALNAEPSADYAAIPLYQPGKTFGVWETGQQVVTVRGAVFLGVNSFDPTGPVLSFSWARNAASEVAREILGDRPGTVAFASVDRDGHAAVFEDFPRAGVQS